MIKWDATLRLDNFDNFYLPTFLAYARVCSLFKTFVRHRTSPEFCKIHFLKATILSKVHPDIFL